MWMALLALAAAPDAGTPPWEVMKRVAEVEVPGTLRVENVEVSLHAYVSKASMDALLEDFLRQFQSAGLFIAPPPERVDVFQPRLTGFDPVRGLSHSVILLPNRDHTTTVVLGVADHTRQFSAMRQGGLPMMPEAEAPFVTTEEGVAWVSYLTRASPQEVFAFYRDVLARDGYREVEPGRFRKASTELRVTTGTRDGARAVQVLQRATTPEERGR